MSEANVREWVKRIVDCDPVRGPDLDLNDALYGADVLSSILTAADLPQTPALVRSWLSAVLDDADEDGDED